MDSPLVVKSHHLTGVSQSSSCSGAWPGSLCLEKLVTLPSVTDTTSTFRPAKPEVSAHLTNSESQAEMMIGVRQEHDLSLLVILTSPVL